MNIRSPGQLDWGAWKRILYRLYINVGRENLMLVAAGMAFYGLLGLVPAIGALAAVYGMVADAGDIRTHLELLADVMPAEALDILRERVDAASLEAEEAGLGWRAGIGVLLAAWTAKAGVNAAMTGLNLAYRERDDRSIVVSMAHSYALTLILLLVAGITVATLVVTPTVMALVPLGPWATWLAEIVRWPIAFGAAVLGLGALYRWGPHRRRARASWLSWGAVTAATLWVIASLLFTYYVRAFGAYGEGYGALGAVLALLMWFWLSALCALLGGALNAEMEYETQADTTIGPERPKGARGAWVADHHPDDPGPQRNPEAAEPVGRTT
jgi:membrane protein